MRDSVAVRRRPARPAARRRALSAVCESLESRRLLATFHVAATGADAPGGGSTAAPFRSIQFAINQSASGDTIKVAAGAYLYNAATEIFFPTLGTTAVVSVVNKELTVLGGFTTSNWTTANPSTNVTTIDGNNTVRGVLVLSTGPATSLRMEGFTIANGVARGIPARGGDSAIFAFGGGMFIDMGGTPGTTRPMVLRNMVFSGNRAIGENTLTSYGGAGAGGGLAVTFAANVTVENSTFSSNQALGGSGADRGGYGIGGAVHVNNSVLTGSNLTFTGNSAVAGPSAGSGVDSGGVERADALGGALAVQIDASATLTNVTATGNAATGGAAGAQAGSGLGGALFAELGSLSVTNSTINNNTATGGVGASGGIAGGGAFHTLDSTLLVDRSVVSGNQSLGGISNAGGNAGPVGGGGLYLTRFNNAATIITLRNSIISANHAEFAGAGNTIVGGGGAGVWLQGVNATLDHVTLAGNTFGDDLFLGQGLIAIADGAVAPTVVTIRNSIVADHTNTNNAGALRAQQNTTINLERNLFSNNTVNIGVSGTPGVVNGGGTTLAGSTGFVGGSTDPRLKFRLLSTSAAINQSQASVLGVDLTNTARSGTPDLGALEFIPPTVQFSAVDFSVAETGGSVTVTVTRSGWDLEAFSVNYATSNGTAQSGSDYGSAAGTLNFAVGQISRTFAVTIMNDSLPEGSERATLSLSGVSGAGAVLGALPQAVVTIVDDEQNDNGAFISGLYPPLLERAADAGGVNFFRPALDNTRTGQFLAVVTQLVQSTEYRIRVINGPSVGYFALFLGRSASGSEQTFFLNSVAGGARFEDVAANLLGTTEYFNLAGGTNLGFLQKLYTDVLGRALDSANEAAHLAQLGGGTTRQQVAASVLDGAERRDAFVRETFRTYLARPATAGDLAYWVGQLASGVRNELVIAQIAATLEAFNNNGNSADSWINALYVKLLGRNADPGGRAFFANQIIAQTSFRNARLNVANTLVTSSEFRGNFVRALYTDLLGRAGAGGDVAFWVGQIAGGATLESVESQFLGTGEYFNRVGGTNLAFLQGLYLDVLGRAIDPSGQAFFLAQLNGGATRASVALAVLTSGEYRGVWVGEMYQSILGRAATTNDRAFWAGQIAGGTRGESVLAQLAASDEAYRRYAVVI